jgi:hypothetical protein
MIFKAGHKKYYLIVRQFFCNFATSANAVSFFPSFPEVLSDSGPFPAVSCLFVLVFFPLFAMLEKEVHKHYKELQDGEIYRA